MRIYLLLLFSFLFISNVFCQLKTKTIEEAINKSDSIWLVSHTLTYQKIVNDDPKNSVTPMQLIVKNGKINYKIIKEKTKLKNELKTNLINILTQPNTNHEIKNMQCFLPHHAILFFKNNQVAFLDICFGCMQLQASKGIGIKDIKYAEIMWKELEDFFLSQGIKYQIPMELE